jgi:hypothetical protein
MSTATKIHFYSTRNNFEGDPSDITNFETTPMWHPPNGQQQLSNIPSNKKKNHKKLCKYLLWFFGLFILCIIIGGIGLCFYFEIFNFKKYNTDTSSPQDNSIKNITQTPQLPIQYIPQTPQVPVQPLPQTQKPYVYVQPIPQTQKPYVYVQPTPQTQKPQVPVQPIPQTQKPYVYERPVSQTQKPQVPVQPIPQTQKPQVPVQPVSQTQKPYVYERPIPQTQKPQVPVQPVSQTQKPYVYERPVSQTQKPHVYDKNISKDFKITDYHKINLNNVYISLAHQTECIHNKKYQCWSSKLEFIDEIVENVHVEVSGIVDSKCKVLLNEQCTEQQGVRCFKMSCDTKKYLYFYTHYKNSQEWILPKGDVFFLLEKGNYHSAWQAAPFDLSEINREYIRLAHLEIQKFNYFEHYPMNQLLLVFTKIFEKNIGNAVWYSDDHVYIKKLDLFIPIHAHIDTGPNKDEGIQLHERIHEYINSATTGKHNMIKHLDKFVYIGDKTVNLVLKDSQYDHTLSKQLVFLPKIQRYGLLMQDSGHLGNWGKESAPSNYGYQSVFRLGKYTMSVINEAGYYMT